MLGRIVTAQAPLLFLASLAMAAPASSGTILGPRKASELVFLRPGEACSGIQQAISIMTVAATGLPLVIPQGRVLIVTKLSVASNIPASANRNAFALWLVSSGGLVQTIRQTVPLDADGVGSADTVFPNGIVIRGQDSLCMSTSDLSPGDVRIGTAFGYLATDE